MNQRIRLSFLALFISVSYLAGAQENSPFSRYGLGDIYQGQNIINRGFGGIGSTYSNPQSVNFSNPASYSQLGVVTYDIGLTLDTRGLRSANPVQKYNSVNLSPSFVALGIPLTPSKSKNRAGLAFGLRPMSKVNYNIAESKRLAIGDSIVYLYEGNGGLYQGFVGIGKEFGKFRIGLNTGYLFGNKENNTRAFPIDSVLTYKSNSSTRTSYNNFFFNLGLQYEDSINKNTSLTFGFNGNLKHSLNATQTVRRETFEYDFNANPLMIDSVYNSGEVSGKIDLPATYTAGIALNKFVYNSLGNRFERSMVAVEYESAQWSQYRFFGLPDKMVNSWQLKVGGQITPDIFSIKSYWNWVTYRAGFYIGKDAVNADGNTLPVYGITFGAGFPIRKYGRYDNQSTIINTTFEIGKRGNNKNNITESFFRAGFSVNLSDRWFVKRKYD